VDYWANLSILLSKERRFAVWAEREGIDLAYSINSDLEDGDEFLNGHRLLLSVGHDEYWSWAMRDAVEHFVANNSNVAFLSGNTCYWQVRVEDRRMIGWKHRYEEDPVYGTDRTPDHHDVGRPSPRST